LNAIAALRAPTMATKIHSKARQVTVCLGHANAKDASANGRAKTVWEKRIKLAKLAILDFGFWSAGPLLD